MKKYQDTEYWPAPFWFLNHKLEKKELSRQLRLMKEQHINSFFMHPRAGLLIPYGSREYFEIIRFIVEEAEKLGMKAWLYDEDPYPSGQAGGRIIMENPEFAARELTFQELNPDENGKINADLGSGRLLEAVAVRIDADGRVEEIKNIFDEVGVLRREFFQSEWRNSYYAQISGRIDYFHYRAETFYPRLAIDISLDKSWSVYITMATTVKPECKYDFLPDNLNPDCVKAFIRLTHEQYKKHLGDKFGKTIPGIFTDETATGGRHAWTPRFEEEFEKRRDFSMEGSYFRIFKGKEPEDRKVRDAYWKTVQELFIESFYKPINDWCKENSLQLCGHGIAEEDPLATTNGMNIFALQKYVGIPGFDHITPNIPNGKDFKSLNLGGRLVASAAAQIGEPRIQSECFACNPYNFGYDGMKKVAHWLYALGITYLIPHGFHYSYDGYRKDDAGKSFFFQNSDYKKFHIFADCMGRLGCKLAEAESMASVCILYPVSVFRSLMPAERDLAEKLRESLYDCLQFMFDNHIQFELADDDTLESAIIENKKVICGKRAYSTIVSPFKELDEHSFQILEKLSESGVEIINFPETSNALIGRDGFSIHALKGNASANALMTLLKKSNNGKILYIFNNQPDGGLFEINLNNPPRVGFYLYDSDEDCHYRLTPTKEKKYSFDIQGYGARLLEVSDKELEAREFILPDSPPEKFIEPYLDAPEWDYAPPLNGIKASLRDWDIKADDKFIEKKRYCLIREALGTDLNYMALKETRPIFDCVKLARRPYPANVEFETCFMLDESNKNYGLLAENDTFSGNCRIFLNDIEISLKSFKRVRRYDPWNIEANIEHACRAGENTIKIQWHAGEEFDGLRSMIYIISRERKNLACPLFQQRRSGDGHSREHPCNN